MNTRSKKLLALLLSASMILSSHVALFAAESGTDKTVSAGSTVSDGDLVSGPNPTTEAQKALSGNVTVIPGAPYLKVSENFTLPVQEMKEAVINDFIIIVGDKEYFLEDNVLYENKGREKPVEITGDMDRCFTVSFTEIRKAGSTDKPVAPEYSKDNTLMVNLSGNQIVSYKAKIDTKKVPGAKGVKELTGEIFVKTSDSGEIVKETVPFFNDGTYDFAIEVDYDGAVEYRGSKVTATSHYLTTDTNSNPVTGEVDGAIGVSARLVKISSNGVVYPMEINNGPYFWKDDSGITLKKPKMYNSKKLGAYYDKNGPYFKIKMSYSKKTIEGDPLSAAAKAALKTELNKHEFHFTLEPRRINTELITYSKYDPDKYYIKKLTYNEAKDTLKGNIQFRGQKRNKSTLNARKLKNVGKKMKLISKSVYEKSSSKAKKCDAFFEYSDSNDTITLTAANGYYGTAVLRIDDKHVVVKRK